MTDEQMHAWVKARTETAYNAVMGSGAASIDDAIDTALELWAEKAEPWLWAAWDIWDQIAAAAGGSSESYESESLDGWSYKTGTKTSTYEDRAKFYKEQAEASEASDSETGGETNTFQNVAARWSPRGVCDENSR